MDLPALTVVIGGAASGKSAHAEALVLGMQVPPLYIATAQAFDAEMAAKIAAHQAAREGAGWETIEAPLNLHTALGKAAPGQPVLLDCVSLWLSNMLLADKDIASAGDRLLAALAACKGPVVVVTNEVGAGIVPDNALARRFRNAQGRLNQRLAAAADKVVLVTAGLPLTLKGSAP